MPVQRDYFPAIQALRALAVLAIVWQHSVVFACVAAGVNSAPYLKALNPGVELFFCISGFVTGLNRHLPPAEFAFRRALRVYPGFWLACGISLLVLPNAALDLWAAALLPATTATLNNSLQIPYWTLIFAIVLYAMFTVALSTRIDDRLLSLVALGWIGCAHVAGAYFPDNLSAIAPGWLIFVSPFTQLFAFGLIACLNLDRLGAVPSHVLLSVAVAAIFVVTAVPMTPAGKSLFTGIGCMCIVLLAARAAYAPRWATRLGDASYGIYLLHMPVLVFLVDYLKGFSALTAWLIMASAALVISTAFGLAEHQLHRLLTRLSLMRSTSYRHRY